MEASSSDMNKYENYFKAYKSMIFINEISQNETSFEAFLIDIQTIPNFIKAIEEIILDKDNKNKNSEEILKNKFKKYKLGKYIKILYLFEECEYFINKNLENENTFIIVNKFFLQYMNININNKNKKVIINIDKNKSLYFIKFPNSNKSLNFIELKPGIYQFIKNKKNMSLIIDKNNSLISKISSKYTINIINSYIKDKSYLLKLIKYSKYIQKHLDINLINYQEKYINKRIHYENFLSFLFAQYEDEIFFLYFPFFKVNLNKFLFDKLEKELLKNEINYENIKIFVINYFNDYYNNLNNKEYSLYEFSKDIEFCSPFFDSLINTESFNKIFNIIISAKKNKKYNLKESYKSNFEKLNKSNIEYSSITLYIEKKEDINLLKEFNINFNKLKKLKLLREKDVFGVLYGNLNFMEMINSFNIQNNLVYFEFGLPFRENDINQFEIINNFKSLKYLGLSYLKFSKIFELKLNTLRHLKLSNCTNLSFSNCNCLNLNYLKLKYYQINLAKVKANLINCPELNKLILIGEISHYDLDFKSFQKLKIFKGNIDNFLLLEDISQIEEINLQWDIDESMLKQIIKKKKVYKGKTNSVRNLKLNINQNDNLNLNDFLNIFPNLSDLIVETRTDRPQYTCGYVPIIGEKKLIITKKSKSNIKNLKFVLIGDEARTLKFSCQPFNKIKSFSLYTDVVDISNLPFFKYKYNATFSSLESFSFSLEKHLDKNGEKLIKNLYNNIDKMPNLIEFYFSATFDKEEPLNETFYYNFMKKVITLKSIKKIFIRTNYGSIYSKNKLKLLFPGINIYKFYEVTIYKFK